ncbi:transporter substrate-binding domain-containing protein [Glaciimonas sp. CA11.2]|uniref:substrate-binding periplasmic protein n=1 Tax=Glaciimonas sp. CA11.2 TaxID=3048601 RepID=UPI002AB46B48|nr:transporter substrate-binding domain-containing protein [Glaciimonas sp. CA11.2]MDY7545716.1 transporter substrate-binding domain-containing protein [Glaciimonas sp. CA11.2]MEB0163936.1 transporter substrate-binding domain-containing protein [Glaciimonas sp. CA11.2]
MYTLSCQVVGAMLILARTSLARIPVFLSLSVCLFFSAPAHAEASADFLKITQSGVLKVAVYDDFAPFSSTKGGIDIDIAEALAKKLGLKVSLLPFPAGEDLSDDLRNMVWKGHYLGYGPADLLMHVPVDPLLINQNDKVSIFAPYHRETVRLVRDIRKVPELDNLDSITGKTIGAEKISIGAMLLLGAEDGKFRENVKIYPTATEALEKLKAGKLDGVVANRSEIESVIGKDPHFQMTEVTFQRLPRKGWVIGMAVKKDDPELAKALQDATDALVSSGEMAQIFAKHGVEVVTP